MIVGYFPKGANSRLSVFSEISSKVALQSPDLQVRFAYTDAELLGNWMNVQPGELKLFYSLSEGEVIPSMLSLHVRIDYHIDYILRSFLPLLIMMQW